MDIRFSPVKFSLISGYSIFIVLGELPDCDADQLLKLVPAVQTVKPTLVTEVEESEVDDADPQVRALKEESRRYVDAEDASLQKALQLSMEGAESLSKMF